MINSTTAEMVTTRNRDKYPLRVQAIFFCSDDSVLLAVEGENSLARCIAFYTYKDALEFARERHLIPISHLQDLMLYEPSAQKPTVVGGWTLCAKNALEGMPPFEANYSH